MTILQSLAAFYDRLNRRGEASGVPEVPAYGFKPVEIDFVLEIDPEGRPLELKSKIPPDGRRGPKFMMPGAAFNPAPDRGESEWEDLSFSGRTSGRRSYLFWDKSSYVFGVAAKKIRGEAGSVIEPEVSEKSRKDHEAFVAAHRTLLYASNDPALTALLRFIDRWAPEDWETSGFPNCALDRNIAFELRGSRQRIDQLEQAKSLALATVSARTEAGSCLISGETRCYAAKHPQFKGVAGAQSSGAAMVSFNQNAFESYEFSRGANAPVSEEAAFKYGAALNWLLDAANGRRFRLGETTVVFWADDKEANVGEEAARAVEDQFWIEVAPDDAREAEDETGGGTETGDGDASSRDIDAEQAAAMGRQAQDVRHLRRPPDPSKLKPETRMHVLGLSPNSGRIAVRFWLVDTWGHLAKNLARHRRDVSIEPPGRNPDQKAYALLYETAVQRKRENIPPRLGGELARAILTGARYPRSLFSSVLARIRADKTINAARAGICKAVINRDHELEVIPVALNAESGDESYNLGRLFAVYEYAERSVADRNATIRDKYIGAASATPRRVFPILMRGYEHNASALAKGEGNQRGAGVKAAKAITQILDRFGGEMPFPTALPLEDQGRFFVGYYHQRAALYSNSDRGGQPGDDANQEGGERP